MRRRRLWTRYVLIGTVLVYFLYAFIQQQVLIIEKNRKISEAENLISRELKLRDELVRQKNMVNTDEYAEKIARERLVMVKSGEEVFIDINK